MPVHLSSVKQKPKELLRKTRLYKRLGRYLVERRARLFDAKHDVHTSGRTALRNSEISSFNISFGNDYEAVDTQLFQRILGSLKIRYEDFVFIDFGSGKGMALLLASEYLFKKVVGIEFSSELHNIAQDNIKRYTSASQKCRDVESLCVDAISYCIPPDPAVLFFYNPFREEVLAPVLANIQESIKVHPREVVLIYVNPLCDHLLKNNIALVNIENDTWHSIYRSAV